MAALAPVISSAAAPVRILLVDDEPLARALVEMALVEAPFPVTLTHVANVDAGLEAMSADRFDLYLIDYRLPGRDGLELVRAARAAGSTKPIIMLTGYGTSQLDDAALAQGATDLLDKALVASHLTHSIKYALQRARTEDALRASEQRLKAIIESEPECVKVVSRDGRVLEINAAGLQLMQADNAEQILGRVVFDLVHPDDRAAYEDMHRRAIAGEPGALVYRSIGLKGGLRWADAKAVPLLNGSDSAHSVLSVTRDITERRQLEEQLRQAQKMEAVGRLAGGIAHDFNNMLTAMLGYCELILEKVEPGTQLERDVAEVRRAAQRAAGLTQQLLAFSRRQVIAPTALDLNAVLTELRDMLPRLIGENIDTELRLSSSPAIVKVDRSQMQQVIMNLVVNARDAMPRGGRLVIATSAGDEEVVLSFADTGVGMDEEAQAHIFEPFFTTKERGTGLGLATVYGIVRQADGSIQVRSTPGEGTTFELVFPRARPDAAETAAPAVVSSDRGTETILLVEDDGTVRGLARQTLAQRGYRVIEASDPDDALRRAATGPQVDLLLTDVVMPVMSGHELSGRLAVRHPRLRVLFMSGYTADEIAHHGVLDQGVALLDKPFTPRQLAQKVREVLDSASQGSGVSGQGSEGAPH